MLISKVNLSYLSSPFSQKKLEGSQRSAHFDCAGMQSCVTAEEFNKRHATNNIQQEDKVINGLVEKGSFLRMAVS